MSPTILELSYAFALIIIAAIFVIAIRIINKKHGKRQAKNQYEYRAKACYMTKSEAEFFKILYRVASDRYYIFPQAHLSAILDHKVPGQNWKGAFRHINGKSVDYVLCDKQTLKPVYAVELDDYTHQYSNRQERDHEVERMLQSAGVPFVRFSNYKTLTDNEITERFIETANNT